MQRAAWKISAISVSIRSLQTEDGNFFAVGEGYKRQADAAGIAFNVLAGSSAASTTKIKVTDMLMLSFDQQFNIKTATIYDMNSTNVALLPGMDFAQPANRSHVG